MLSNPRPAECRRTTPRVPRTLTALGGCERSPSVRQAHCVRVDAYWSTASDSGVTSSRSTSSKSSNDPITSRCPSRSGSSRRTWLPRRTRPAKAATPENFLPEPSQHIVGVTQVVETAVPPGRLVDERLVDELAQLGAERVGARRQQLGHEDGGELLGRVDPEAVLAAPPQCELARGLGRPWLATGSTHDREAEAEADAVEGGLGEQPPAEGLEVGPPGRWLRVM